MARCGIFINNGVVNKRIFPEELNDYLNLGWSTGMKKRSEEQKIQTNAKREQTCLKKYGVKNVHQSSQIKDKCKSTCIEKYGVDNPAKSAEIKLRAAKTNAEKWPDKTNYHNMKKGKKL